MSRSAGWPAIVVVPSLDQAVCLAAGRDAEGGGELTQTAEGTQRAQARVLGGRLDVLFRPGSGITAGVRLLPAAYFQNWLSGLIHSDLPIFTMENVPSPLIPISPLQLFVPRVRLKRDDLAGVRHLPGDVDRATRS